MIWLSILAGIAVTVLLLNSGGDRSSIALRFLIGGLMMALGFRVTRWLVLRRVRIGNAWNGFIEVGFDSETYAKEFSELNRLALLSV